MPVFAGHCEDQAGITPDSAGSAAEGTGAGPGRLGPTPRLAPSLWGGGACHLWGLALHLNTKGPNEMSLTPTFGFRQLRLALFWGLGAGEAGGRGVSRTVGSGHEHGSRLSGRSTGEGLSLLLCDSVSSREKMRVRLSAGAVRMRAAGVWGGRGRGQAGRRGLRVAWLGRPQLPGSLGGQRAARLPLVSRVASWAAAVREPLQYPYDSSSSGPERTPLPGSWGAGRALRQLISHVCLGHCV